MRICFAAVFVLTGISACVSAPKHPVNDVRSKSTPVLWINQEYTRSALELAAVEAELGRRGETHSSQSYLGKRTSSAYGRRLYARSTSTVSDRDCSSFRDAASAQQFFLANGGPASDPHNLDGDGDGFACEWGTTVSRVAKRYRAYRPRSTRSYSKTCYTGPRGGTYTITASGNKNYDGC